MHDLRVLREQIDLLRDGMRRRGALDALAPVIDRGETLERERRDAHPGGRGAEGARATPTRRKSRGASAPRRAADELIAQGRALGDEIARSKRSSPTSRQSLRGVLLEIPNVTLADGARRRRREQRHRARVGHAARAATA